MLGPPPHFPVLGPEACVRAGRRLAPQGPVMTELHWPQIGGHRAKGWARVWWNLVALWQFLGSIEKRAPA